MQLKIVTWNANHRDSAVGYLDQLMKDNVDIILLQDVQNTKKNYPHESDLLDYQAFYLQAFPVRDWGNAILINNRTIKKFNGSFDGQKQYQDSSVQMCYDFTLPNNQKLSIINAYANPEGVPDIFQYETNKSEFMKDLDKKMNDMNFVVFAGDLNIDIRWDKYHEDKQQPAFKSLDVVGLVNCFENYGEPIWTRFPWQNDHIFVSRNLKDKVIESKSKIHNKSPIADEMVMKYSDHVPLEITIDFD